MRRTWRMDMKRKRLLFSAMIFALVGANLTAAQVTISNTTVIDVRTGRSIPHRDVVIDGDRIASVRPTSTKTVGLGVIDGTGTFLIPGLWDAHVHTLSGGRERFYLRL